MNKIPKLESGNLTAEVFNTGIEIRTGGDAWLTERQAMELHKWLGELLKQSKDEHGFPLYD
jgi:hypothetical protein